MTNRRPLPRAIRDGPFSVRDALERGVDRHRLDRSDLSAPFRGVRAPHADPPTDERPDGPGALIHDLRQFAPLLARDQAFSHTTAAIAWEIPLPRRHETVVPLHVVTLRPDVVMRRKGVVGHRAGPGERLERHRGVAVTDPASTWAALGQLLGVDELVVAGDAIVGELRLATIADLEREVTGHAGSRGVLALRTALAELRPGCRSPGETRLRLVLTRSGLPEPVLNHDVVVDGRWIACVDFAFPRARVALEYDSDLHRTDPEAYRKDLTRAERLKDAGWWTIRATAFDVGAGASEFTRRVARLISVGSTQGHRPTDLGRA